MRADISCIREYARVYPFYRDRISGRSNTNRLERVLYKQGKSGLRRVPASDSSEDIHRLNIIGRYLPMGKPSWSTVLLFLIRYSK